MITASEGAPPLVRYWQRQGVGAFRLSGGATLMRRGLVLALLPRLQSTDSVQDAKLPHSPNGCAVPIGSVPTAQGHGCVSGASDASRPNGRAKVGIVNYDAILFDFDGTLVDSEPIHYECWLEILAPFGVSLTWEEYCRNCIGVSDQAMVRQLADGMGLDFEAIYSQYPRKKELLRDRMLAAPPMEAEIRDFLLGFEALPMGLVTSSYRLEVEPVLEALSVKQRFVATVFGDEVKNLKPHPEPYLLAAERLGVRRPLVFEDSEAGLASARAAGFTAIRVKNPKDLPSLLRSAMPS